MTSTKRLFASHLYALILAGGSGTRLWPLSRERRPKQHLALVGTETLLQATYRRMRRLVPAQRLFIATHHKEVARVRSQLPHLKSTQLLIEPERRGTAAAIAFATVVIYRRDPSAILATINSDAYVVNEQKFLAALATAAQHAYRHPETLTILGIPPTYPETGYGYILAGRRICGTRPFIFRHIRGFYEKPTRDVAQRFLKRGNAFWNTTILIAHINRFFQLYQEHAPKTFAVLEQMRQRTRPERLFQKLETTSLEYDILEHERNMLVLPVAGTGWADIGHWRTIQELSRTTPKKTSRCGHHLSVDARENFVVSSAKKIVATIGVDHLIVIDTPDALLICHKDRAQDVKGVVAELKARGLYRYL